jgi:DNA gyrase subunit A
VNLLAGPGKGVTLIKLGAGDEVLSAFTASRDVSIEKSTGATQKITAGNRAVTSRGGKGQALLKRGKIKGVVGPEIVVPDLAAAAEEGN